MPIYVESRTGRKVDASVATANGRPLPGYAEILADGERIDFGSHLVFRDAAPGASSVFLTDDAADSAAQARPLSAADRQAQIVAECARDHAAKQTRNAQAVADAMARDARNGRTNRMAAMLSDARYTGAPTVAPAPAAAAPVTDHAAGAATVSAIRAARYR